MICGADLLKRFQGTAADCFDNSMLPVQRPGGQISARAAEEAPCFRQHICVSSFVVTIKSLMPRSVVKLDR